MTNSFSKSNFDLKLDTLFVPQRDREVADNIEWINVDIIDDNPFQPRTTISDDKVQRRKESLNSVGQLQSVVVRPHPTKAGRFQQAFGHVRKQAVRAGGNAGIKQPAPHEFIGKLMVEVRALNDFEMLVYALRENEDSEAVDLLDRARSYAQLREMAGEATGKRATWPDIEKLTGLSYRQMRRVADLLELPDAIKTKIARGELNERHGRALLLLQNDATRQKQFLREIEKGGLSGTAALKRGEEIAKTLKPAKAAETSSTRSPAPTEPISRNEPFLDAETGETSSGEESAEMDASGAPETADNGVHPLQAAYQDLKSACEHLKRFTGEEENGYSNYCLEFVTRHVGEVKTEYRRVASIVGKSRGKNS